MKKVLLTLISLFLFLSLMTEPVHADTDVGQALRGLVIGVADKGSGDESHPALSRLAGAILDLLAPRIKATVEEEIRTCIRKIGDTIGERIMENERVEKVVFIVELTCWTIMIYLVLVTFFLFFTLRKLYVKNRLILKLLQEMKQGGTVTRATD